jgi:hypothetical protein
MVKKTRVQKRRVQRRRKTQRRQQRKLYNKKRYVGGALDIYMDDAITGHKLKISHRQAIAELRENSKSALKMHVWTGAKYVPLVSFNKSEYMPRNDEEYPIDEFWGDDITGVLYEAGIGSRKLAELKGILNRANNADSKTSNSISAHNSATNAWNIVRIMGINPIEYFNKFISTYIPTIPNYIPLALQHRTAGESNNNYDMRSKLSEAVYNIINACEAAAKAGFNPFGYIYIFSIEYSAISDPPIPILMGSASLNPVQRYFLNTETITARSNELYTTVLYPDYQRRIAATSAPAPEGGAGAASGNANVAARAQAAGDTDAPPGGGSSMNLENNL